jgi:membrane protein required for colicin V production
MNNLDLALLIGAGLFTLLGAYWGVIRQVLSIVGLLVGVAMAGRFGPDVAVWLSSFVEDPTFAGALGFILVLVLVSAAASVIASVLRLFAGLLFLGWLDHLLGAVLGLAQAVLAGAAILIGLVVFPQPAWSEAVATSTLAEPVLRAGALLAPLLPDFFMDAVRSAIGF